MTCIVAAVRNGIGVIGSDSLGSNSMSQNEFKHGKITSNMIPTLKGGKPIIFGYCGSFRLGDLLRYQFTPPVFDGDAHRWMVVSFIPALKGTLDAHHYDVKTNHMNFLTILDNRVFEVQDDYSVIESANGYASVGSGEFTAVGAMHVLQHKSALEMVRAGLKASAYHSVGVGGEHHIYSVKGDKITKH